MKPIYVFIFTIGVCLGQNQTSPNSDNGPKAPTAQGTNHSPKGNKGNRDEPNHDTKTTIEQTSDLKSSTNETTSPAVLADLKLVNTTESTPLTTLPPPPPQWGIGSWNVTDDKGNVCILLKGEMTLNMINEMNKTVIRSFPVPKNAHSHGNCLEKCIEFELPNNSSLHLMFEKNTTSSTFYLHAIKAKLYYETGKNNFTHNVYSNDSLRLFENPLAQSYYCAPSSDNLVATKPMLHLMLKVNDFQVQAFMNSSKPEFDSAVDCETHTPDVVPIVVGCALAILVILVLVAYLISRRRSQSRGYLSM